MKFKYTLGLIIFIALSMVYYKFNPEVYNFFPECPFHKLFNLDCPGCGSQRAIHSLLHGDIIQAANYNLLLVMSLPVLIIHFFFKVASYLTKEDHDLKIWYSPVTPKIIFTIVILFWIARNLPYQLFKYLAA
ncbi:DUF2752 domain-containing protein [Pedobacter chinensis]|uniref:DUF2752 domain-containing protein n=1 Tax=Pedobacter chinensis TaxID=2282421 RepID=A0A369PR19_9SPHI|nr:DUF2752 domain-containing protein [Pedobacter chinensis]